MLNVLHPILEPQFEGCSFAYRPGRSHLQAVRQVDQLHRSDRKEPHLAFDLMEEFRCLRLTRSVSADRG